MDHRSKALDTPAPETGSGGGARRVLVIDTDPGLRWALDKGLTKSGYEVHTVNNLDDALRRTEASCPDCIVLEILPEAGLTTDALSVLALSAAGARIVCISVDAAPKAVIECMRCGAADFLPKPFSLAEIRNALARCLKSDRTLDLPRRLMPTRRDGDHSEGSLLIGISTAIQELRTAIEQVAKTDLNCLVRGESGTGKDMVAREIHRLSVRHDKPFVKVNCTALPEALLESELFGYEKGAFTGAVSSKPGRFELAHNGIIFLDEIGDMHPNLQAKLLQVIEHKEFTKLGGARHIHVDVQIIAATNANLESRTRDGSFRSDLYFRLNEVCLWVPSLAQRKEDVPLLVRHFIQKHGRYTADDVIDFSGEDLSYLTNHDWPGNVRELESTIKRWLALGKQVVIAGHADARQAQAPKPPKPKAPLEEARNSPEEPLAFDPGESALLLETLRKYQWNRRKAADALGMSYQTLRRRIEKYGLAR